MADESLSATTIIHAPAEVIFAVLADPTKHAAIDGTGWVREPLDSKPLTAAGQVFRSICSDWRDDGKSGSGDPCV